MLFICRKDSLLINQTHFISNWVICGKLTPPQVVTKTLRSLIYYSSTCIYYYSRTCQLRKLYPSLATTSALVI